LALVSTVAVPPVVDTSITSAAGLSYEDPSTGARVKASQYPSGLKAG